MECKECKGNLIVSDTYCSLEDYDHFKYAKCEKCGTIHLVTDENDILSIKYFDSSIQIYIMNEFVSKIADKPDLFNSPELNKGYNFVDNFIKEDCEDDLFDETEDKEEAINSSSIGLIEIEDPEQIAKEETEPEVTTEPKEEIEIPVEIPEEHVCKCGGNSEGCDCECHKDPEQHVTGDEIVEVPEDIEHQLEAKDFGDYLIISDEFNDNDMLFFTGSKDELNEYIAELKFHSTPKVYGLKQLEVETIFRVK